MSPGDRLLFSPGERARLVKTLRRLQRDTPPGPACRGRRYLDAVGEPERRSRTRWELRVQGSRPEPYRVAVQADPGGAAQVECSCPYREEGPCKHAWAALERLLESLQPPAPGRLRAPVAWRAALELLDEQLELAEGGGSSRRVVWRLAPDPRYPWLEPWEERRAPGGGWSLSGRLSWATLASSRELWTRPDVAAVARWLSEGQSSASGRYAAYGSARRRLDVRSALHELVGCAHVRWLERPAERVRVRRAELAFELRPRGDALGLRPTLGGADLRAADHQVERDDLIHFDVAGGEVLVGRAPPGAQALLRAWGCGERVFPRCASADLEARLARLAELVPVLRAEGAAPAPPGSGEPGTPDPEPGRAPQSGAGGVKRPTSAAG